VSTTVTIHRYSKSKNKKYNCKSTKQHNKAANSIKMKQNLKYTDYVNFYSVTAADQFHSGVFTGNTSITM